MKLSLEDVEWIRSEYKLLTNPNMKKREYESSSISKGRGEYQRDYARILYSSSFRRLQGKMQLLGIENDQFFRNRLTHSLEVSQIAEGIATTLRHTMEKTLKTIYGTSCKENQKWKKKKKLPKISFYEDDDLYVLRGACLAHDLGNTPFGHAGETVLNRLSNEYGGFEGNGQTIRILRRLEKKSPDNLGLNLTLRSLLAVLKYNVTFQQAVGKGGLKSKFIYNDDFEDLLEHRKMLNIKGRTLDSQIMDLADEIAYSAHDLEDCLSLKVFDIDELAYEFLLLSENKNEYKDAYIKFKEIIDDAKKIAERSRNLYSSEEYKDVLKKEITTKIVGELISDIGVVSLNDKEKKKYGTLQDKELGFKTLEKLAEGLKKLTFKALKRKKHVKLYEAQGEVIIERLYNFYIKHYELIATEYVSLIEKEWKESGNTQIEKEKIKVRYILDYISGMMDSYAVKKYIEFFGEINLKDY